MDIGNARWADLALTVVCRLLAFTAVPRWAGAWWHAFWLLSWRIKTWKVWDARPVVRDFARACIVAVYGTLCQVSSASGIWRSASVYINWSFQLILLALESAVVLLIRERSVYLLPIPCSQSCRRILHTVDGDTRVLTIHRPIDSMYILV